MNTWQVNFGLRAIDPFTKQVTYDPNTTNLYATVQATTSHQAQLMIEAQYPMVQIYSVLPKG